MTNTKRMTTTPEFIPFPKMARLSREIIITEKIDGTNAQIFIDEGGNMFAGSRNRWLTPEQDNFGFATWVKEHQQELAALGPGRHFGEWWGQGIQRGYGLKEKRFSLFNVVLWCLHGHEPQRIPTGDPRQVKWQQALPPCCGLVPVLYRGPFETDAVAVALAILHGFGSVAAPGFMNPEGVVVFHTAGNVAFKKTLENDETGKGQ